MGVRWRIHSEEQKVGFGVKETHTCKRIMILCCLLL